MYRRNAQGTLLQTHDLGVLAMQINDVVLTDLARSLENRVGHHMRMRYPDVGSYPDIPADVYSEDDVMVTLDLAERAVEEAQSVMMVSKDVRLLNTLN